MGNLLTVSIRLLHAEDNGLDYVGSRKGHDSPLG